MTFKTFSPEDIRKEFPILSQYVNGEKLVYLDSAASSQKPQCVIDAVNSVYTAQYANIHRGVHTLGALTTQAYEQARVDIAKFIGARTPKNIIFTRGGTEAINLVAHSWARTNLSKGDTVTITQLEHHANIVPWQILRDEMGLKLAILPMDESGAISLEKVQAFIKEHKPKLLALPHVANTIGTLCDVEQITQMAHENNCLVLVDGCQAVPRLPVDVTALDVDFYVFSGHKCYAPSGTGILYAKEEHLNEMRPYQSGGDMIEHVSFEKTTYAEAPAKFEAGTPNIEGAIGLGTAVNWLSQFDMAEVWTHEQNLHQQVLEALKELGYITYQSPENAGATVIFNHPKGNANDVAMLLDECGIAIRSGHHCAEPLHNLLGISGSARASFGIYSTQEDIDALKDGLARVNKVLGK
jgi:cysteine desulfurase/selenocysteine lyase